MQQTRVLLARHAETAAPDRFHGAESDIGLSEVGARQAELLGEFLKHDRRRRGLQLGDAPGRRYRPADRTRLQRRARADRRLHERRIGPLSGLSREEGWAVYAASKTRWIAGDLDHTHEGGESYNDVRAASRARAEELAARHAGETIIVVVHGVVIRVALTSLLAGAHPSEFDRFAIDFASVNDLRFDGKIWMAHALNVVIAASDQRPVA